MEHIIKAIEEKLSSQETEIFVRKHEVAELKKKLEEAEKIIESQAQHIEELSCERKAPCIERRN